ncbi:TPA: hypothetical protein ACY3LZ_004985, partial [Citrobacter freundii]
MDLQRDSQAQRPNKTAKPPHGGFFTFLRWMGRPLFALSGPSAQSACPHCAKSGSSKTANGDDQTGAGQSRQNNTTYPDYSNKIKEIETNKGGVVIPAFIKFTSFLTDVRLAGSSNKAPSKR